MQLKLKYSFLSALYFFACITVLMLFMLMDMSGMEHGSDSLPGLNVVLMLTFMLCVGSALKFLVVPRYKLFRPSMTVCLYVVFFVWAIITTFLNINDLPLLEKVYMLVRLSFPIFAITLPYNYILNHRPHTQAYSWYFCIFALLFAAHYFYIMSKIFLSGEAPHMVVSYFVLFMLPFILMTCGRIRQSIFVIFTAFVLITSVKRGGIITMAGSLFVFGLVYNIISPRVNWGAIFGGMLLVVALGGMFVFMADTDENNLIERFQGISDDEGSGRTVVWGQTIKIIEGSDAISFISGHGYNTVYRDSAVGLSAHNDFLEVTYDYGIIGLIIYVLAVLSLLRDCILLIFRRSKYAPPFAMMLAIYLFTSMASHVIIYSWANIVLLFISYTFAQYKFDAIHQQNNL